MIQSQPVQIIVQVVILGMKILQWIILVHPWLKRLRKSTLIGQNLPSLPVRNSQEEVFQQREARVPVEEKFITTPDQQIEATTTQPLVEPLSTINPPLDTLNEPLATSTSTSTPSLTSGSGGSGQSVNNENNAGDDNTVNSENSETTAVIIENENILDFDNAKTGVANTGDNTLTAEAVLKGNITTGNSGVSASQENKGNTNEVSTGSSGGGGGGSGWVQHFYGSEPPFFGRASNSGTGAGSDNKVSEDLIRELSVINKNLAFVSNDQDLLSNTGRNKIIAGIKFKKGGIFTGNARAKSSLLNIINTNTIDSVFLPLMIDITDNFLGNLNILDLLFEAFGANLDGPGAITSTAVNEGTGDESTNVATSTVTDILNISNENQGFVFNDLRLDVISGQNKILAGQKVKEVKLVTGAVDVTNNLITFLNNNLFRSKVGVIVINVFGDWAGNLILPSAWNLAQAFPDAPGAATVSTSVGGESLNEALAILNTDTRVVNDNTAGIDTQIEVEANSGFNRTFFDEDGKLIKITAGATRAQTNLLSLTNRNVYGGAWSTGIFNILGEWTGSLVGVPEDARVTGSDTNFVVSSEGPAYISGSGQPAVQAINSNTGAESTNKAVATLNQRISINNKNVGHVVNKLKIRGDSGHNDVAALKGKDVEIRTGPVRVASNVATIMNNNFTHTKALTVAFNVFGNWRGNIAYDELKDLGVNIKLLTDGPFRPGQEIIYEVSATNRGTELTEATTLSFTYDPSQLSLIARGGASVTGRTLSWPIPVLDSAESRKYQITLRLSSSLSDGLHTIETSAHAPGNDENVNNDTDIHQLSLEIMPNSSPTDPGNGSEGTVETALQNPDLGSDNSDNSSPDQNHSQPSSSSGGGFTPGYLLVNKTVENQGPYRPGDLIKYKITVQNPGNTVVRDVIVYDQLINGTIEAENSWALQDVQKGEVVTVDYELGLTELAMAGPYTNTAYASGFDAANAVIRSGLVSTTIAVENDGSSSSSGGAGGGTVGENPDFGVIEGFNQGATSTVKITREVVADPNSKIDDDPETRALDAGKLTTDEEQRIENELEEQMQSSSKLTRHIAPVARAADLPPGVHYVESADEVAGASTTRLAVYPSYLNFSGLDNTERLAEAQSEDSSIFSSTLFWIFGALLILAGYISFRERQRKLEQNRQ